MVRQFFLCSMVVLCSHALWAQSSAVIDWQGAVVTEIASLNKAKSDSYMPVLSHDGTTMFFVSNRVAELTDSVSGKTIENKSHNLWHTTAQADGSFDAPQYLSTLNSSYNEGGLCIGPDGTQFLFVACERPGQVIGDCDILMLHSVLDSAGQKHWRIDNLGYNVNSKDWESTPALAPDGTLFFSSNRAGGYGGQDIWYCLYNWNTKTWESARNAGPVVNTNKDEIGPFVSADGTMLLFSSNGHTPCYGGKDFYMVYLMEEDSSFAPQNLGEPLNSGDDDLGIYLTSDNSEAYFSSDRNRRFQIYKAVLPAQQK